MPRRGAGSRDRFRFAMILFDRRQTGILWPISLEERLVKRQLRFGEALQATPLAQRIDFDEFAAKMRRKYCRK